MSDSWLEISCDIPELLSDEVADFLTQLTGNGVCVDNLNVDAFSPSEIPVSERVIVKAYLANNTESATLMEEVEEYIQVLAASYSELQFLTPKLSTVHTEDWSSSWKIHFKPLRVGERLLIVPTWEENPASASDLVIRIDPGMAFGTGGHETTRLCLELLEQVMSEATSPIAASVLDLGTGSGILAMAAQLLGAGRILALDIDAEAVDVARENLALNNMSEHIECDTIPVESLAESFDVLLANILAEELIRLRVHLVQCLNPGASLILSGILAEKEQLVRDGFADQPLLFKRTEQAGEWVALLYQKEQSR